MTKIIITYGLLRFFEMPKPMNQARFLRIVLPTPLNKVFDYLLPENCNFESLKPGVRVLVPFGSRKLVGILVGTADKTDVPKSKMKAAIEIMDNEPIMPQDVYDLCCWSAKYYHYSLGEIFHAALPVLLRKAKKPATKPAAKISTNISHPPLELNHEQKTAVDKIVAAQNQFKIFLLNGVTGSGKTEVYLQVIEQTLNANKQVLVLVPEISLTPQTIKRFSERFSQSIVALHSSLTDKERLDGWQRAKSGEAKIIIGTRSAIFTAFANLGLIIIDEEHDNSFKQQDRFRYHARDLAVMRASKLAIPVVLGSATPSLESLLNVKRNRYTQLLLTERAGNAVMPTYQFIDLRTAEIENGLAKELVMQMQTHLENNNQVMLFLNRRGFAPVLYCNQCAWIAECRRCDARMTYHRSPLRLQCHHCDCQTKVPIHCPACKSTELEPLGLGTQRLETTLRKYFPDTPIMRIDRDSTRKKGSLNDLLAQIHLAQPAILLGTQMLAKGHHFPQVTLVGIVDADNGLFSADFRASEQMGQLLLQVSGRAGRADKAGTVLIQTRQPEHPLLQSLLHEGYEAFSQNLLSERERTLLPPYTYFAIVRAEAYAESAVESFLEQIKNLSSTFVNEIKMLGPVPAILAKRKGLFCKQLILKSLRRSDLQSFIKDLLSRIESIPNQHAIKWVLDVDPVSV